MKMGLYFGDISSVNRPHSTSRLRAMKKTALTRENKLFLKSLGLKVKT